MAHYALQKLHIRPSEFESMSREEKAFLYASTQLRVETEKREADKMKR